MQRQPLPAPAPGPLGHRFGRPFAGHHRPNHPWVGRSALALAGLLAVAGATRAQPEAPSAPCPAADAAVLERFISADCADCWAQPAPEPAALARPPGGGWQFDWIVPGRSADAPLAAAALADASDRLQRLALDTPVATAAPQRLHGQPAGPGQPRPAPVAGATATHGAPTPAGNASPTGAAQAGAPPTDATAVLRAHLGPGWLGRYMALEFVLTPPSALPAGSTGWLAMVELLPAGTDGSPVARALVRNVAGPLTLDGAMPGQPLHHLRAMRWPESADPLRLQARAWVEAPDGRLLAVAADRCAGP